MSEKADIWMPMYIGDYLSDTTRLTTEQHGAYLLMLFDYWKNGPLPDDQAILQQITKLSPSAWSNHQAVLRAFFKQGADGLLHQKRADFEKLRAVAKKTTAVTKARRAAAVRHSNGNASGPGGLSAPGRMDATSNAPSSAPGSATSNQQGVLQPCPSPSPSLSISNTSYSHPSARGSKKKTSASEGEHIYLAYPKHKDKEAALKAIARALGKMPYLELLARVERFAERVRKDGVEMQFVKYPATWFNAGSYEDDDLKPPPEYEYVECSPEEFWKGTNVPT